MKKALFQFTALVFVFFGAWFAFSRIDYVRHFHLNSISARTEKKLGDAIMKAIKKTNKTIDADSVQDVLDKINAKLCGNTSVEENDIHIYLVQSSDINAFALPGNNLVVYTGLVRHCDSASELCGVIAHEIGHIRLNHVMKRLAGEVGFSVLSGAASNGKAAGQIVHMLSSSAFERKQESDADAFAVQCLLHAHISPAGFGNLMDKMARLQSSIPEEMEWISSHPDSKKRAETIRASTQAERWEPVITDEEWAALKIAARD